MKKILMKYILDKDISMCNKPMGQELNLIHGFGNLHSTNSLIKVQEYLRDINM